MNDFNKKVVGRTGFETVRLLITPIFLGCPCLIRAYAIIQKETR
jgi:hypothetical protein